MADTKPSTSAEENFYQAAKAIAPTGAKRLVVRYYGEGDSGDIEGVFVDGQYNNKLSDDYHGTLYKALRELYFAQVSETNEGGGGEIEANFEDMTVTRTEYYNVHTKEYLPEEKWQIW